VLDKLLYDVDRAIDLLIVGTDGGGNGEPEQRAAAYGWLIRQFLLTPNACLDRQCAESTQDLPGVLQQLSERLLERFIPVKTPVADPAAAAIMRGELCLQLQQEDRWENLVTAMAPSCTTWERIHTPIVDLLNATREVLGAAAGEACPAPTISLPPTLETSTAGIAYLRSPSGSNLFGAADYQRMRSAAIANGFVRP
jgi:hypothetical protein